MTIRAKFSPNTEDVLATIHWLNKTGLSTAGTWKQVYEIPEIEIQLRETPSVLAYFSQVEDAMSISRITDEGIVFYLTDISLWSGVPEDKRQARAERYDGKIFIPMANVICINTFGSVYVGPSVP